jgi:hypothetical protein
MVCYVVGRAETLINLCAAQVDAETHGHALGSRRGGLVVMVRMVAGMGIAASADGRRAILAQGREREKPAGTRGSPHWRLPSRTA